MGESGEDIQLSPHARTLIPYSIECKSRASFSIYSIYEQAASHKNGKYEPLVFIKANNKKPLAILDAEKLVQLIANGNEKSKD